MVARPDRIRTRFDRHDPRFARVNGDENVEVLYDAGRWVEGPAYSPLWRCLLFSDIPNDRVLRWDETTGRVGTWRTPAGYANGRIVDRRGRVLTCEQGSRSVTRTEHDGSMTVLADRWQGHRLNSPNDLVEHSDGSVWFTDPSYGIDSDYEGQRAPQEIDGCHVYRIAPDGVVTRVAEDFVKPNGLAFSADERTLYVADTASKHVRRFDVVGSGSDTRLTAGSSSPRATRGASTASGSTTRGGCGWRPATACTASTRTEPYLGSCSCRRSARTSPSAAPRATSCSSQRARRSSP